MLTKINKQKKISRFFLDLSDTSQSRTKKGVFLIISPLITFNQRFFLFYLRELSKSPSPIKDSERLKKHETSQHRCVYACD